MLKRTVGMATIFNRVCLIFVDNIIIIIVFNIAKSQRSTNICHAGQPMVLDQRWAAPDSGPGQSTLTLSPPEIAAEVYAPIS